MKYRTIVADPPWHYSARILVTGNAPGRTPTPGGSSGTDYPTLSVGEIATLPVSSLAEADAHLYLWTTNTHAEHAWSIAREWGFSPRNLLTWCKRPKGMIGFGTFSQSSEFVLFASRGTSAGTARCERTWFEWPRTLPHSAKPEAFLDLVEQVSPGPYLELFTRRNRLGWDGWGNESLEHVTLDTGAEGPPALERTP